MARPIPSHSESSDFSSRANAGAAVIAAAGQARAPVPRWPTWGEDWRCDRKLVAVEVLLRDVVLGALVGSDLGSFFGVAALFHAFDHARFQGLSFFD